MKIAGFIKNSFVDYRGKVAAVIFTPGCNLDCYFCHNRDIISIDDSPSTISEEDVLSFLEKRKDFLDGVVISGGEPTLQVDLMIFLKKISNKNLPIKLDTNGTNPSLLSDLLKKGLLNYVAMDIKAPLNKYNNICGTSVDIKRITESINLLKDSGIEYEFRTTVVPELELNDLISITKLIKNSSRYVLQQYKPQERHKKIIDLRSAREPHKPSFFHNAKEELNKILECVEIKGI